MLAACAVMVLAAGMGKLAYDAGLLNRYMPKNGVHLPGRTPLTPEALASLRPARHNLPSLAVNPQFGTLEAPVVLTVFTDPACAACRTALTRALAGIPAKDIRIVYKYWPENPADTTSGLALVLAGQHHKTQELYSRLTTHSLNDASALLNLLDTLGLPLAEQRRAIIENGNTLAADLQPDLQLAHSLNLAAPPQFFINGYHIDGQVLTLPRLQLYIERLKEDDALLQPQDYWLNSLRP